LFYGSETGWPFFEVLTDSTGRFDFSTISFRWTIYIEKDGYKTQTLTQQIWPDSTIELNIVLQPEPEYYQSYFPLQVGNIWKYYHHPAINDTLVVSINEQVTINEKLYYNLNGSYVRFDSLGNLLLHQNSIDTILYPLTLNNQDSIITIDSLLCIYSSKFSGPITVPAGDFSDCVALYYEGLKWVDSYSWKYFIRNIGLVEEGDYDPILSHRWVLYYAKVNGVEYPTSGIQPNPGQPETYALQLSNYPNPFNSSTTLKYHLPETGDVRLSVFDLSGRLVEELFTGRQSIGDYHYLWSGGNLPSGVYLISLQAGDQRVIQKCLLMK
ncbi:MAG: T9SS type A sorting domain-containing protein, partial [Candidatus Marinimicrobia bacterium]|nr:T9SS type A sorting domain-containing protein [Candidatus Neomarinimicrobiota bacterium]